MSADVLLSRLDGVRQTGPSRWIARCPAHDDRRASLSVRELDDGRILLHDFAGCDVSAILGQIGVSFSDLFPERITDHARPERRPFPAADVLRALAHETFVVVLAASKICNGGALNQADYERLLLASERVQAAREAAGL